MNRTSPLTILAFGVLGCAATPAAVLVRGPDGETNWVSISCKGDPTACEVLAGQWCPTGYDFGSSSYQDIQRAPVKGPGIGPAGQGAQGVMWGGHVLVKCHGPAAAVQAAAETGAPAAAPPPAPPSCHGTDCAPREAEDPSVSGPQRPE
ncbi:MAG: hypothetical protein ABTD50_11755 [Polyangiaceae bacterium]